MDRYEAALNRGELPIQDLYALSLPASIGKFVSVSFYFGGVDYSSFKRNFGKTFEETFEDEVTFVLERGYMERASGNGGTGLFLTKSGVENFNGVIALFYAPSVQSHLIALQPPKTSP